MTMYRDENSFVRGQKIKLAVIAAIALFFAVRWWLQ
jgi:hypothetical protein